MRRNKTRRIEFVAKKALSPARVYYGEPKLKQEDVRCLKLIEMESIAKHFNLNIRVSEPAKSHHDKQQKGELFMDRTNARNG